MMLGENLREQEDMGLATQISPKRCQVPQWSGSLGLISLSETTLAVPEQPVARARASNKTWPLVLELTP